MDAFGQADAAVQALSGVFMIGVVVFFVFRMMRKRSK
jgi:preprotein translocase subunit YajC